MGILANSDEHKRTTFEELSFPRDVYSLTISNRVIGYVFVQTLAN